MTAHIPPGTEDDRDLARTPNSPPFRGD
jgi:hypothetical protein